MSHNSVKIGNSGPDHSGLISPTLADLSDVSAASITDGQTLAFNSTEGEWQPATLPSGILEYLRVGNSYEGTARAYSTSGRAIANGESIAFYDEAPLNTVSGATITTSTGASAAGWKATISLPAGTYSIMSSIYFVFSTSGYLASVWRRKDTNANISSVGVIGATLTTYASSQSSMLGTFTLASAADIECVMTDITGVAAVASQGNNPAQMNTVIIRKLS
jgi:hypothetical protein